MAGARSSRGASQKHLGKERSLAPGLGSRGEMSQKQRNKVDNAKEKMCPPDSMTEAGAAGEKKQHTRCNTSSFSTKRSTPQLKKRTETVAVDPHDRANAVANQEHRESAAIDIFQVVLLYTRPFAYDSCTTHHHRRPMQPCVHGTKS
jgi:hypothetical protein